MELETIFPEPLNKPALARLHAAIRTAQYAPRIAVLIDDFEAIVWRDKPTRWHYKVQESRWSLPPNTFAAGNAMYRFVATVSEKEPKRVEVAKWAAQWLGESTWPFVPMFHAFSVPAFVPLIVELWNILERDIGPFLALPRLGGWVTFLFATRTPWRDLVREGLEVIERQGPLTIMRYTNILHYDNAKKYAAYEGADFDGYVVIGDENYPITTPDWCTLEDEAGNRLTAGLLFTFARSVKSTSKNHPPVTAYFPDVPSLVVLALPAPN